MALLIYCGLITAMTSSLGALLVAQIAVEFELGIGSAQWVVTSSLLAGAVATPILGRAGDGHRAKPVLLVMLALIGLGSALSAIAASYPLMLLGRVLQGLTFGVVPVCINVARQNLPNQRITAAVAALSVTTATGVGIGFPLTGLLADVWGFRAAFWVAFALQLPAIALVALGLDRGPVDFVAATLPAPSGTLVFVGGMVMFVGGVSGSLGPHGPVAGLFGLILLAYWGWAQGRSARPLLAVGLLRDHRLSLANLTALLLGASMHIAVVSVCQIVQAPTSTAYGLSATLFVTGCFVLPLSAGSQVSSQFARHSERRSGSLIMLGAVVAGLGNTLIILSGERAPVLLGAMLCFGLGIGVCWASIPRLVMVAVPRREIGSMLAFNQILRTLGGAVGTALAGWLLSRHSDGSGWPMASAYQAVFALNLALCGAVAMSAAWLRRPPGGAT